ncbi:MAG: hypothetical protein ACPGSK_04910, partial [Alphaproteobacteria bacterium]
MLARSGAGLSAQGLVSLGLDPQSLWLVQVRNDSEALWAFEEVLDHPDALGVVCELCQLELAQSHRLNLKAAETAREDRGRLLLALRRHKGARRPQANPTAAVTRWRLASIPPHLLAPNGRGQTRVAPDQLSRRPAPDAAALSLGPRDGPAHQNTDSGQDSTSRPSSPPPLLRPLNRVRWRAEMFRQRGVRPLHGCWSGPMRRMVSVVCPSFALWAQQCRTDPADPLVLTVEQRNLVLVHDASPAARAAGAAPGQPLTDARALVPKLKSVAVDLARITAGWHRVAHWLTRYTPLVALDPATPPTGMGGNAGFMLDISGCAHLFGGEAGLLQDLSARAGHWGLGLQAAMADTPLAAWGLARYGGKPLLCVPPGETRAALYPLPVTALNLPEPTVEALDRLGLRRIKDLVALDRRALGQRFSEKLSRKQAAAQGVSADRLLDALDRATGQRADVIDPLLPAASYAARKLFPEPIGTAEAIEQTLIDLMAVVLPMVRRAGQGVRIALV